MPRSPAPGGQPWKAQSFRFSTDPELVCKVTEKPDTAVCSPKRRSVASWSASRRRHLAQVASNSPGATEFACSQPNVFQPTASIECRMAGERAFNRHTHVVHTRKS